MHEILKTICYYLILLKKVKLKILLGMQSLSKKSKCLQIS